MIHLVDDITRISWKYGKKIKNAVLPLTRLGITYFAVQKVTADGHWNVISSDPAWIEHSLSHKLYLSDSSLVNPQHYSSGVSFVDSQESSILLEQQNTFNVDNGLIIINKYANQCEYFFLASQANNKKIINTYLNKMNYIRKFCEYFKKEYHHMIHRAADNSVDLKKWNPSYSKIDHLIPLTSDRDDVNYHPLFNSLTPREKECVTYLLKGNTAKETAKALGLSYRTIEEYYEILKRKLHCKSKRDLYKIFE